MTHETTNVLITEQSSIPEAIEVHHDRPELSDEDIRELGRIAMVEQRVQEIEADFIPTVAVRMPDNGIGFETEEGDMLTTPEPATYHEDAQ